MTQQSVGEPSPPASPEHTPGAAPASTSAAGTSSSPLQFTYHGSDGTVYQVDSREDEILFQRLEEDTIEFSSLIDVSARDAALDLLHSLHSPLTDVFTGMLQAF